ncbi:MAG: hypothetical protein JWQ35_1622 [Bacteriovoracaceae bacterium]|nr:hypothetical protein [Bacteriovoracaceae bacterium]
MTAKQIHNSLFSIIVEPQKLHPNFRFIMTSKAHAPARAMLDECYKKFTDIDGNFLEQFQSTGFDSRIWELYLHQTLLSMGFDIDRSFDRPDFIIKKGKYDVGVEAVTTGFRDSNSSDPNESPENIFLHKQDHIYPIRFGSALFSKLKRKYWELPQMSGKPLIFGVEPFHAEDALGFADAILSKFLYGKDQVFEFDKNGQLQIETKHLEFHVDGEKKIHSNFFEYQDAQNISAVIFSNSGTIAKFNRMGYLAKQGIKDIIMIRFGTCYRPNPNASEPLGFLYQVGDPNFQEDWSQGLSLFHNPNCKLPISNEVFSGILQDRWNGKEFIAEIPGFHVLASKTLTFFGRGLHELQLPGSIGEPEIIMKQANELQLSIAKLMGGIGA